MNSMWLTMDGDNNSVVGREPIYSSSHSDSNGGSGDPIKRHFRRKDILTGQHHASSKHYGNVFFKETIRKHRAEYHAEFDQGPKNKVSGINAKKKQFCMKIYSDLQRLDYRFVDKYGMVKDEKYALQKIGQALREKRFTNSPGCVGSFDGPKEDDCRTRPIKETLPPFISLYDPTPVPLIRPRHRFRPMSRQIYDCVMKEDKFEDCNKMDFSFEDMEPIPYDFCKSNVPTDTIDGDAWNELAEKLQHF